MRTKKTITACFITSVVCLLVCNAASANPYLPSLAELLAGSRAERLLYTPLLVLLMPLLLATAGIESIAARRYFTDILSYKLFFAILIANIASSIIGWYLLPSRLTMWSAVMISYVSAILLEWPIMWWLFRRIQPKPAVILYASARMNTVSYALISLLLLGMLYVPVWRTEDKELLKELTGKMIMADPDIIGEIDAESGEALSLRDLIPLIAKSKVVSCSGTTVTLVKSSRTVSVSETVSGISEDGSLICKNTYRDTGIWNTRTHKRILDLKSNRAFPAAFSPDNRYCAALLRQESYSSGRLYIVDIMTGKRMRIDRCYGQTWLAFSPAKPILAWSAGYRPRKINLVDARTGKRRSIFPPGYEGRGFAWSPDGKYLAYRANNVSDIDVDHLHPNIRVVTADGKRSVTIHKKAQSNFRYLLWVK